MLHQSVKPIYKAIEELLQSSNFVGPERLDWGSTVPHHLIYIRNPHGVITKSKTVLRFSEDLAKRTATALAFFIPAAAEPAARIQPGDNGQAHLNKMHCLYKILNGETAERWYVMNTYGAHIARDRGLPPNTIQIDIVRDGVIFRNEPYTQYTFDEMIRSIEHAEAQQ